MAEPQPADEWDYLRPEGDDDVDGHPAPEEAALHEDDPDRSAAHDPGRSDDSAVVDLDGGPPEDHFPDEELERPGPAPADDHEPDLEEILESQHYAFGDPDEEPT